MTKFLVTNKIYLFLLSFVIVIHFLVLSRIVYFPYPELFIYPYLVAKGFLPYKQIFDQHFPGLMFFPINLFTLGMKTPEASFVLHLFIVGINHLLIFVVGRKYFGSNFKTLIANILYLVWQPFLEGYVLWIDSFIPVFFLSAYYFLLNKNVFKVTVFSLIPGFILGLAVVFKQTSAPLFFLIFIYLLIKKRIRYLQFFILSFALPIVMMLLYFAKIGVLEEFWYWTVTFNLTTFAAMGRKYPTFIDLLKAGWVFGPAFLLIIVNVWRKNVEEKFVLLLIFFLASLVFAYARFDFIHLQPALPFLVLLMVQLITLIPKKIVYLLYSFYILGSSYLLLPFYRWANQGRTLFFGEFEYKVIQNVGKYAKRGDTIFAFGTLPHLYFLTDTLPPGRVFVFQFPWFMKEAEERILKSIMADPPKVVVRDKGAEVEDMNLIQYMPKINDHIEKYYYTVDKVDGTEIMIPN